MVRSASIVHRINSTKFIGPRLLSCPVFASPPRHDGFVLPLPPHWELALGLAGAHLDQQ
jgi:hypothetical protein